MIYNIVLCDILFLSFKVIKWKLEVFKLISIQISGIFNASYVFPFKSQWIC